MKFAAVTATALAVLTAGASATPSMARDYRDYGDYADYGAGAACHARKHDNGTAGAVLGGIAGALLGSSLASHHGGRAGGAALGAVAGALLGNTIGRSSAKGSEPCEARDYGQVSYQSQPSWNGGYWRGAYRPDDRAAYRQSDGLRWGDHTHRGDDRWSGHDRDDGDAYDTYGD
jgi:hypothetical protein